MIRSSFLPTAISLAMSVVGTFAAENPQPKGKAEVETRRLRASDVFTPKQTLMFQDNFQSGTLDRWNFSENDQYELAAPTPERIQIVDAPGLPEGRKAVRFVVQRAPNSFRSEISLPSEKGFQERWYAARVLIPEEWVFDPAQANDIVMQWHAIPGNWSATYPNLEISVGHDRWNIRQSFGSPQTKPTRTSLKLDEPVQRGAWVSWVIHAKWSPREDGLLQIWKDGKVVLDRKGPNVYGTIGLDYTPYFKTGIYHPEWHLDDDRKRAAFEKEQPVATKKIVYVTDIKIGNAQAKFEDVAPPNAAPLRAAENPFIGRWALTLPNGAAGWLGVEQKGDGLTASLLWGGGSVLPVGEVSVTGDTLLLRTPSGKMTREITATRAGNDLALTTANSTADGTKSKPEAFAGHRIADLPPAPDLAKVVFGSPIKLLAGDLDATWRLVDEKDLNGWSLKDGVLANRLPDGKHPRLGNLRTKEVFGDFRLTTEVRTQPGSNSGIYLRGTYEIQVADSFGKPVDSHNMGALYSRITPSVAAEKAVGEWQTFEITLVDRHVTVILNGQRIIDNQPVLGCTGGALTSDESQPGPIMLQGDHTTIDYRNMEIFPVGK